MLIRATFASIALILGLGVAQARDFTVTVDQAGLIRLPGEAAAIIVGNPGIADASLFDARTVFVTGKVFGRTNLIALDARGRVLYTSDLVVSQPDTGLVQVYRSQTEPETYVCAPVCQAVPQIGDEAQWFSETSSQRQTTVQQASTAAPDGN